jgi:hypothetical protein
VSSNHDVVCPQWEQLLQYSGWLGAGALGVSSRRCQHSVLYHCVYTGSGTKPAPCPVGAIDFIYRDKLSKLEDDHSRFSSAGVKCTLRAVVPLLPRPSFLVWSVSYGCFNAYRVFFLTSRLVLSCLSALLRLDSVNGMYVSTDVF